MSAHVMRADRSTFASNDPGSGTDADVRAAFEGHVSYFGTYTVDPIARTVIHHVRGASYPNWDWSRPNPLLPHRRPSSRVVDATNRRSGRGAGVHSHLGTGVNALLLRISRL